MLNIDSLRLQNSTNIVTVYGDKRIDILSQLITNSVRNYILPAEFVVPYLVETPIPFDELSQLLLDSTVFSVLDATNTHFYVRAS